MRWILTAVVAGLAGALAVMPATAAKKSKHQRSHRHSQTYRSVPAPAPAPQRAYPDPSFGNREGINRAYQTGRCVQDLGYGRYKYCGW